MAEEQTGPFAGIVAEYEKVVGTLPTSSEYMRAHRVTTAYTQSLDQTRHAHAIRDAWKRFNDDYPDGDSAGQ